jgi:VanZ family protein
MLLPGNDLPSSGFLEAIHFDKFVHLVVYFVLYFLWCYGISKQYQQFPSRYGSEIRIVIAAVLYGVLVEGLQHVLTYQRSFETADIIANTAGVTLGLFGWLVFFKPKMH